MVILSEKASHKISHGERNYFQTLYLTKDQNLGRRKESGLKEGHAGGFKLSDHVLFLKRAGGYMGNPFIVILYMVDVFYRFFGIDSVFNITL